MNRSVIVAAAASLGCWISPAQAFIAVQAPVVGVAGPVTALPAGQWAYAYTVTNDTACFGNCFDTVFGKSILGYVLAVREFALPYFGDAGITAIQSPADWQFGIVDADRFSLGQGAKTLVWTAQTDTAGIAARGASLGGFGYSAAYAAGKGPFSAALGTGTPFLGDPAIPRSPNAIAAGIPVLTAIPEPQTCALLLAGLAVVAGGLQSKARRQAGRCPQPCPSTRKISSP